MSVWGLLEKAAEVVGGPAVTVAVEGGKALAGLFGTTTVSGQATMSPEALVKMITTGPGAQGLDPERQENTDKAQVQNQIGDETRQHMTTLESAWTGGGADAAHEKLQQATSPVAASSEAMTTNASTISGQMEVFTTLKNSLHTDVTDNPPQKSTWDNLTPWDTDTEDAINANNAKVQQNLDAYNSYTQASQSYAPQLKTDYGQVTDLSGNTFQIQQPATPSKSGSDGTQNTVGGSAYSNGSSAYSNSGASAASIPRKSTSSSGLSSTTGTNTTSGSLSGSLDDTTIAAGYTSPGSGGSSYSPTGSGGTSDYSSGGFGPLGGAGFGPMGGGGSGSGSSAGGYGSGSGSSTGAGSGTLSGGKATGGVAGESGVTGAKAGAASAAGAAGRGGTSGMGAGRGGKGEGGEDAEHQRPSYLVEADPDSLFGTNEKTAPPVIGL
jgi:hypothetical protein